jgi:23S rRNA pseudouridine2457 synthase
MTKSNQYRILRFYKPYGVHTKFTDDEGRATLKDYIDVPDVYAAGRLDHDSEGLLILTDDGVLNARLTDPRFEHPKTYLVQVERMPNEAALDQLRGGVILEGEKTRPALAELVDVPPDLPYREIPIKYQKAVPTAFLQLTITEGKKRQVRRMTAAIGHPTIRLIRLKIGEINLAGLKVGEWRDLTPAERKMLYQSLGLKEK